MVDFGNAVTGAATGGGIGSAWGLPGTALGALGGGLYGLFGGGKGKKEKIKQTPNYTPEQMQLINEAIEGARNGNQEAFKYLQSILSDEEGAFEDFERPALDQFNEEIIPGILERFAGAGAGSSSAVGQTLANAGRGLSRDLAAQRANLKSNAISQLHNYSQTGLTQQNQRYIQGGTQGGFAAAGPAAAQGYASLFNTQSGSNNPYADLMQRLSGGM